MQVQEPSLRKQAQRLCNKFGLVMRSNEKPGAHLPFDHPSLEAVRTYIRAMIEEKKVNARLCANFDQVWSTRYRPKKKVLIKEASARGQVKDPLCKSMCMRKIRHSLERTLDLAFTEPDPSEPKPPLLKDPKVTGGVAASACVEEWRAPRTVCTLSYMDGHVGRSFLTLRVGSMPEDTRRKLNEQLSKYLVIDEFQQKSHVWNAVTFVRYLQFLAEEPCLEVEIHSRL